MYPTSTQRPVPNPPSPSDPHEAARWSEGRRRRRLLNGTWRDDLIDRLQRTLGSVRRQAWGEPSLAINPFRNITRELAVLYDSPPEVRHDGADVSALTQGIRLSGLWGLMSRVQAYTIGLREYLVRVHVNADGRARFRPVAPDMVCAYSDADQPDKPLAIRELRLREHPETGDPVWTVDVLDIGDPEQPQYRVHEAKPGLELGFDWTEHYLGASMSGDAYPYRRTQGPRAGEPVLPYILHHAQKTGDRLWDPYEGIELVEATLDLAVMHQMLTHCYRDASWPQRWVANLQPAGADVADSDKGRRAEVPTDPAALLVLESSGSGDGQPMVGQFQAGADVQMLEETLSNMVARVAQDAGVPPSDVQRLGGTARSGAAISLTNEGKRAAQRRYAEAFRDADERLVALTAILTNNATGSQYPEWGYTVAYRELPLSPDELKARREHVLTLVQAGLMSPTQAYRELHPGVTEAQARLDLQAIAQSRAIFNAIQ